MRRIRLHFPQANGLPCVAVQEAGASLPYALPDSLLRSLELLSRRARRDHHEHMPATRLTPRFVEVNGVRLLAALPEPVRSAVVSAATSSEPAYIDARFSPGLAPPPLELCFIPGAGFLGTLPHVAVSWQAAAAGDSRLDAAGEAGPLPEGRLLFLGQDFTPGGGYEVASDIEAEESALAAALQGSRVVTRAVEGLNRDALEQAFASGPLLLHLCGHGGPGWAAADPTRTRNGRLAAAHLSDLAWALPSRPALAFFSVCYSGEPGSGLAANVSPAFADHRIGYRWEVGDDLARAAAAAFYRELRTAGFRLSPFLLSRVRADLLAAEEDAGLRCGEWAALAWFTSPLPPGEGQGEGRGKGILVHHSPLPPHLVGRRRLRVQALEALACGRTIRLVGPPGIGKRSLAAMLRARLPSAADGAILLSEQPVRHSPDVGPDLVEIPLGPLPPAEAVVLLRRGIAAGSLPPLDGPAMSDLVDSLSAYPLALACLLATPSDLPLAQRASRALAATLAAVEPFLARCRASGDDYANAWLRFFSEMQARVRTADR